MVKSKDGKMSEKTIIKIRKGMNGFPYSACTSEGVFITNADSIDQIKDMYKGERKLRLLSLKKELDLYPKGYVPDYKVYGYARVSTKGQAKDGNSLDAQEEALRSAGAEVIVREAYTGKTTDRPELTKLLERLKGGDTLMVTKLDRIARSTIQGSELVKELLSRHVNIHILNMGKIDNSPTGKLITDIFFAFAEFERAMIIERTQEGKEAARRKPDYREGRPRLADVKKTQMDHAMELLESNSYNKVAEMTEFSVSTLVREKRRRKELATK